MGFNFGSPAPAPAGGAPAAGGFSFGAPAAGAPAPAAGGFSFGAPAAVAPAPAAGGFSLGAPAAGAPAPPAAGGFSFGSPAATPAPPAATTPAPAPPAGGFSFGGAPAAPAPAAGGFSFGGASIPAAAAPAAAATTPAAAAPAPAAGGFSFGAGAPAPPAAAPAAAGGFSFGAKAPAAPAPAADAKPAAAAPAAGGFSFGGAAPGPGAGAAAKAPAAPAPAPAAGGLSFGGAAPAPAAGDAAKAPAAPAPAAGGFSFGGAAVPKTPATPATPAPVDTPKPPAGLGGLTTSAVGAPTPVAATSAIVPADTTNKEPVRLEYQTLTVEQILNKFQKELEADALLYSEEAKRVAEYDAMLRDSQRDLATIASNSQLLLLRQEELERTFAGVTAFQKELDNTLETLETHVDQLFLAQSHLSPQDADVQRESAYETAQQMNTTLSVLQDNLKHTLQQMDTAQESVLSKAGDVGRIVHVLNTHQNRLSELENLGRKMELDIGQLNHALSSTSLTIR